MTDIQDMENFCVSATGALCLMVLRDPADEILGIRDRSNLRMLFEAALKSLGKQLLKTMDPRDRCCGFRGVHNVNRLPKVEFCDKVIAALKHANLRTWKIAVPPTHVDLLYDVLKKARLCNWTFDKRTMSSLHMEQTHKKVKFVNKVIFAISEHRNTNEFAACFFDVFVYWLVYVRGQNFVEFIRMDHAKVYPNVEGRAVVARFFHNRSLQDKEAHVIQIDYDRTRSEYYYQDPNSAMAMTNHSLKFTDTDECCLYYPILQQ